MSSKKKEVLLIYQDKHCYNGIRVKKFKTRDKTLAFANLEENCLKDERMDYVIVEADSLDETIDNT